MPKGARKVEVKTRFRKTYGYYYHYYDENLRRRTAQRDGFATEAEALAAGKAALRLHRRTLDVDTAKITFAEFVEEVWKPHMNNRLAESTKLAYKKFLAPVLDVFGSIKMTSLSENYEKQLAEYLDNRYLHTPDAFSTMDNTMGLLKQIFQYAYEQQYVEKSPLVSYHAPNFYHQLPTCSKNLQRRAPIEASVLEKCLKRYQEGTPGNLVLAIGMETGMRRGEIMGLAFEDIDFDNRLIYLTRQIKVAGRDEKLFPFEEESVKSHPELESCRYLARNPKYDSKRIIPISENLYQVLLKKKQEQERNAAVLGPDYIEYHYTREYEPLVEGRTYESFSKKTNYRGGFSIERMESGIINPYGIGYPIHFVNVRENGKLIRSDYATDILQSIHGKAGKEEIMDEFNLHSLRNTFASQARANKLPEYIISAILGHKTPDTTNGYMSVTGNEFYSATDGIRGLDFAPSQTSENLCDAAILNYFKTLDATQRKIFMYNFLEILSESA